MVLYQILTLVLPLLVHHIAGGVPTHQRLAARRLFEFRSYKNVQIFHFRAPAESRNVTFSLTAAEVNQRCYPRQVTIYLQHGSFPVFNAYPRVQTDPRGSSNNNNNNNNNKSGIDGQSVSSDHKQQHQQHSQSYHNNNNNTDWSDNTNNYNHNVNINDENDEYFPRDFFVRRTSLSRRTVMSDRMTITHTVHAPLPGDWYLAAFVANPSQRIKQKGLSPTCHTTLATSAVFLEQSNVVSLVPEVTDHQRLILTQKINNTQFYKFLVPDDVDHVTVNISKCDRKDGGGGFFRCPLVLSLRPLALPHHGAIYSGSVNCSHHVSGVCVLRSTAVPGQWHYVRLDLLPRTVAQFGIQILLDRGCWQSERSSNDYLLVSEMRCDNSPRTAFIPVTFGGASRRGGAGGGGGRGDTSSLLDQYHQRHLHPTSERFCTDRVQLARTTLAGAMTFVYDQLPHDSLITSLTTSSTSANGRRTGAALDDSHSWSSSSSLSTLSSSISSWLSGVGIGGGGDNGGARRSHSTSHYQPAPPLLNVSTVRPTVLVFSVEPVYDIGGTLTVALTLPEQRMDVVNVSVVGCLSLWRRGMLLPDGRCSAGSVRLEVNSTSSQYVNVTRVPYPEPGDWFLTLTARCYLHDLYSTANSYIPCPRPLVSLKFHIESSPCASGGGGSRDGRGGDGWGDSDGRRAGGRVGRGGVCADSGTCLKYFSGGLVFSTCSCWTGYSGWSCTDARFATSEFELLLGTLLLTLSNLLLAPAIALAIKRRFYTEAVVYAMTMICSTFYHACDEDKYAFCVLRSSVLQFGDFYCCILAFFVTLTAMAGLTPTTGSLLNVTAAVLIALAVEYDRTALWVFATPVTVALLVVIGSWIRHCRRRAVTAVGGGGAGSMFPSVRYLVLGVVPGAALAGVGLVVYTLLETRDNYRYTHSAWHCCAAVAVLLLLPTAPHAAAAGGGAEFEVVDDRCSLGGSTGSRGKLLRSVDSSGGGGGAGSLECTPKRHRPASRATTTTAGGGGGSAQHYQHQPPMDDE